MLYVYQVIINKVITTLFGLFLVKIQNTLFHQKISSLFYQLFLKVPELRIIKTRIGQKKCAVCLQGFQNQGRQGHSIKHFSG